MSAYRDKFLKFLYLSLSLFWCWSVLKERFSWMARVEFPPTRDGYFYLQEFKIRMLEGRSYYDTKSVFFSLFSFLGKTFSLHEMTLYNLLFLSGLLSFTLAITVLAAKRETLWIVPSLCILPWNSDTLFFSSYNFLKYSFSLCFLLLIVSIYIRYSERLNRYQKGALIALSLLPMSMHFFTATCGVLLFAGIARAHGMCAVYFYSLLPAALAAIYAFARNSGKTLLEENWTRLEAGWQLYCRLYGCSGFQYAEYVLFSVVWVIIILSLFTTKTRSRVLITLLALSLLVSLPLWNTKNGLGTRLGFSAIWFMMLACAQSVRVKRYGHLLVSCLCICASLNWFYMTHQFWGTVGRPSEIFPRYTKFLGGYISPNSIAIAPHGMQFAVNYNLNMHATARRTIGGHYKDVYEIRKQKGMRVEECIRANPAAMPDPETVRCYLLGRHWAIIRKTS